MATHFPQMWPRQGQRLQAFTLVEVVLAVGIVSFAILSMVALLPVGLENEQVSSDETLALNEMRSIAADLANTSGSASTVSLRYSKPLPSAITSATNVEFYLNDAETEVTTPGKALFRVSLSYYPATATQNPAGVLIQVKWPAYAPKPKSFVESYITFPKS